MRPTRFALFALLVLTLVATPAWGQTFPSTSLLDAFGSNQNPLGGGNWTGKWTDAATDAEYQALSGVAVGLGNGTNSNADYWSATTFGPDSEVYVDIPNFAATDAMYLIARMSSPGATRTGYQLVAVQTGLWTLFKCVAGACTSSATGTQAVSNGDSIGLRVSGSSTTTVSVYYKAAAGSWNQTPIATFADSSSPITAAGFIGFGNGLANTTTFDNFSGGTMSVGSVRHRAIQNRIHPRGRAPMHHIRLPYLHRDQVPVLSR